MLISCQPPALRLGVEVDVSARRGANEIPGWFDVVNAIIVPWAMGVRAVPGQGRFLKDVVLRCSEMFCFFKIGDGKLGDG